MHRRKMTIVIVVVVALTLALAGSAYAVVGGRPSADYSQAFRAGNASTTCTDCDPIQQRDRLQDGTGNNCNGMCNGKCDRVGDGTCPNCDGPHGAGTQAGPSAGSGRGSMGAGSGGYGNGGAGNGGAGNGPSR